MTLLSFDHPLGGSRIFNQRRGIFGAPFNMNQGEQQPRYHERMPEQQEVEQSGFNKPGGWAEKLAGLGDILLNYGGIRSNRYEQMVAPRLIAQRDAQQRQAAMQDWMAQQRWKRENPEPQQPDVFTRMMMGGNIDPNSEEGQALYRKRAENMADPMKMVMGPDGRPYFINPQQQGGQLPSFTQDDWDKAGGGASNGTGMFPR